MNRQGKASFHSPQLSSSCGRLALSYTQVEIGCILQSSLLLEWQISLEGRAKSAVSTEMLLLSESDNYCLVQNQLVVA